MTVKRLAWATLIIAVLILVWGNMASHAGTLVIERAWVLNSKVTLTAEGTYVEEMEPVPVAYAACTAEAEKAQVAMRIIEAEQAAMQEKVDYVPQSLSRCQKWTVTVLAPAVTVSQSLCVVDPQEGWAAGLAQCP